MSCQQPKSLSATMLPKLKLALSQKQQELEQQHVTVRSKTNVRGKHKAESKVDCHLMSERNRAASNEKNASSQRDKMTSRSARYKNQRLKEVGSYSNDANHSNLESPTEMDVPNSKNSGKKVLRNIRPAKHRADETENPWIVPSNRSSKDPLNLDMTSMFEMLWEKSTPASGETFQSCPGVLLADTVCFKNEQYSQPQWYFTSQQDGRIYKKNSVNVTPDNIHRIFTKKKLGTTVKRFMDKGKSPTTETRTNIVAYGVFEHVVMGEKYVSTEFFDSKSLRYFLEKHTKEARSGFIQKFLHSGGVYNTVLKVQWNPHSTMVEQIKNRNKIDDENISLKERMTVDFGNTNTFVAAVISPVLCAQIEKLCKSIVKHIQNSTLSYHRVREMSLLMKLDCHNRLWLQWFHSLTTTTMFANPERLLRSIAWKANFQQPKKHPNTKEPTTQKDSTILLDDFNEGEYENTDANHTSISTQNSKTIMMNKKRLETYHFFSPGQIDNKISTHLACPSCGKLFETSTAVNVSYHIGILDFEQMGVEDSDDIDLSKFDHIVVPPIIKLLEPSLGPIRYKRYRNNPKFLTKVYKVCDGCSTHYSVTARNNGLDLLGERVTRTRSTKANELIDRLATAKRHDCTREVPPLCLEVYEYSEDKEQYDYLEEQQQSNSS